MNVLSNLRVAHRLGIGFGLLAVILLILSGVGLYNARHVKAVLQNDLLTAQARQDVADAALLAQRRVQSKQMKI